MAGNINPSNGPFQNTKGDIVAGAGAGLQPVILPVGANGLVFTANSAVSGGIDWEATTTESTFLPTLAFGGGTTGITYSTQQGTYVVIGPIVLFKIQIILTSKGSSTGTATIGSLPFTSANDSFATVTTCGSTFVTFDSGYTYPAISINANAITMNVQESGSGKITQNLTDGNFAGNTAINVSGFYFTS